MLGHFLLCSFLPRSISNSKVNYNTFYRPNTYSLTLLCFVLLCLFVLFCFVCLFFCFVCLFCFALFVCFVCLFFQSGKVLWNKKNYNINGLHCCENHFVSQRPTLNDGSMATSLTVICAGQASFFVCCGTL